MRAGGASTVPVAVKIDPDMKERMKRLAENKQRTPHWMMREAIRQYVEREEKRVSLRNDAFAAWRECQETGMYAHSEDVLAWLATWGKDSGTAAPACREHE